MTARYPEMKLIMTKLEVKLSPVLEGMQFVRLATYQNFYLGTWCEILNANVKAVSALAGAVLCQRPQWKCASEC